MLALLLALALVIGATAASAKLISGYRAKQSEVENLRAQRDFVIARFNPRQDRASNNATESPMHLTAAGETKQIPSANEILSMNLLNLSKVRPSTATNVWGKKTYIFAELYGTNNQVIARDAQFRELLGYTKLAFRTSEGVRYYDLDDLHPEVIRSLGYDSAVLKRALAEEFRQRQLLAAQAQFQADLRVKAAAEFAERDRAAAERTKAEAAVREAEARERIAAAAERAATNPPRERIIQRFLVVPRHSKIITNAPMQPPIQPSVPSIQSVIQ
jgi:hypothetical protein